MNTTDFSRRTMRAAVAAALLVATTQVVTQPSVYAGPCDGDIAGGVVTGQCNGGGNGNTAGGGDADPDWFVVYNSGVYCEYDPDDPDVVDGDEIPSYIGTIENHSTGERKYNHCVAQTPGSIGNSITGLAKQAVKAPTPEADYKAAFLVGAPIQFKSPALQNYSVDVPNFPGVKLTITAMDVTWKFGDGTESNDLEPVHVYESISPNQENADQHSVKVTLEATWQVNMLNPVTGTSDDLGTFTDTGELDRSIVQVWSKQTEPNS
jgi:hypothetical protein